MFRIAVAVRGDCPADAGVLLQAHGCRRMGAGNIA